MLMLYRNQMSLIGQCTNPLTDHVVDCRNDLREIEFRLQFSESAMCGDHLEQFATRCQLHHNEMFAHCFDHLKYPDQVRVV